MLTKLDIRIQALSDTIGCATPQTVKDLFSTLIPSFDKVEFGAHLHTLPENAQFLVESAYESGCRKFDGAIKGFGGCPMAKDDLTGNMPTERMLDWFNENKIESGVDQTLFEKSVTKALTVFP